MVKDEETDPILDEDTAQPFYQAMTDSYCLCGADLSGEPIHHYEHEGGWDVEGFEKPQWLYVTCPKCGYQMALWKMGVPRTFGTKKK